MGRILLADYFGSDMTIQSQKLMLRIIDPMPVQKIMLRIIDPLCRQPTSMKTP